ncbi:MAG: hypothetical protein VW274_00100 [Thalassolituus sp.]
MRLERKSQCRVCGNTIRLTDQQLESLERTLAHMSDCGMRKRQVELTEHKSEETVTD